MRACPARRIAVTDHLRALRQGPQTGLEGLVSEVSSPKRPKSGLDQLSAPPPTETEATRAGDQSSKGVTFQPAKPAHFSTGLDRHHDPSRKRPKQREGDQPPSRFALHSVLYPAAMTRNHPQSPGVTVVRARHRPDGCAVEQG